MKQSIILLALAVALASCGGTGSGVTGTSELATEMDSISYGAGAFLIGQLKDVGVEPDAQQMGQGLSDILTDQAYIDEAQGREFITKFQQALTTNQGSFTADAPVPFSVDTLSYVFGTDFGRYLKSFEIELSASAFVQGAMDATSGAESMIGGVNDQMMQALTMILQEKQMGMQAEMQAKKAEEAQVYIAEGEAFLAENADAEGVQTTASGLQYKVLTEGSGVAPKATDQVTVHYEGRLINGDVFDSSYARGEPTSFPLNGVIAGWTEGLQLMQPGAKYQFYIPQNLAYGLNSPPDIPPGSTLIFDVELISVLSQQ